MSSFLNDVEDTLVRDPLKALLALPRVAPIPHGHTDPGADLHVRIPKVLADELEAIARVYPTSRTNLVRVFLTMAAREWRVQQKLAIEGSKLAVEKAQGRKVGTGRGK